MVKKKKSFEPQSISEVLGELIDQKNIKSGITKIRVEQAWKETMGNSVAQYTQQVTYRGTTLFVNLTSAALREELSYGKEKILLHLNETLGSNLITKLVLR
jgi:predicted nucleic acid-binding Zn ribbon protein